MRVCHDVTYIYIYNYEQVSGARVGWLNRRCGSQAITVRQGHSQEVLVRASVPPSFVVHSTFSTTPVH